MGRANEKVLRAIARGDRDCDRVGLRRLALDLLDARARIAELEAAEEDGIAVPPGVRPTSVSEQLALSRIRELEAQLENLLDEHAEGTWQARALDAERERDAALKRVAELEVALRLLVSVARGHHVFIHDIRAAVKALEGGK